MKFLKALFTPPPPPKQEKPADTMTVKDLKEYKSRLNTSLARDLAEFEKNFLLVSVGLLAFSITFIKDIVKIETAALLPLLTVSWTFIGLAIGLMLFTFMRSVEASNKIWYAIDDFQHSHKLYVDAQLLTPDQTVDLRTSSSELFRESKRQLNNMRNRAIGCFLAGLAMLFIFITVNLFREQEEDKKLQPIVLKLDPATKEISIEGHTLILKDSMLLLKK